MEARGGRARARRPGWLDPLLVPSVISSKRPERGLPEHGGQPNTGKPMTRVRISPLLAGLVTTLSFTALASEDADRKEVARLDTEYQAAVKRNDADGMSRILHERFVLVVG